MSMCIAQGLTETNTLYMMIKSVLNIDKLRSALFQCFVQCMMDTMDSSGDCQNSVFMTVGYGCIHT